jgi:hypothetical protein
MPAGNNKRLDVETEVRHPAPLPQFQRTLQMLLLSILILEVIGMFWAGVSVREMMTVEHYNGLGLGLGWVMISGLLFVVQVVAFITWVFWAMEAAYRVSAILPSLSERVRVGDWVFHFFRPIRATGELWRASQQLCAKSDGEARAGNVRMWEVWLWKGLVVVRCGVPFIFVLVRWDNDLEVLCFGVFRDAVVIVAAWLGLRIVRFVSRPTGDNRHRLRPHDASRDGE